jgi:hypothetical protein
MVSLCNTFSSITIKNLFYTACRYIVPIMADINNIGALVFKFQIDGTFDHFDKVAVKLVECFLHLLDSQTSIFIYLQTYFL